MTNSLIPGGQAALRNFAQTLEDEAKKYDKPRYGKERSTVAETLRLAASLARQQASRMEPFVVAALAKEASNAEH